MKGIAMQTGSANSYYVSISRRKAIPKTSRMWKGVRIFTHCQNCGKKLPKKPVSVNFQLLTRLCRDCYTMELGMDYDELRMLPFPKMKA